MTNDFMKELMYSNWRFDLWHKNYGSYREIDWAVSVGLLIPHKKISRWRKFFVKAIILIRRPFITARDKYD